MEELGDDPQMLMQSAGCAKMEKFGGVGRGPATLDPVRHQGSLQARPGCCSSGGSFVLSLRLEEDSELALSACM
jgi:hypothetical protein